ncbi:uncharacterized protein LOC126767731 isoform X1 [Bactrocera neohumeralis]|uniref:uncharacterized protein LOC120780134 isoform X1 n=1 Tax=Bactrocera tryoni TaxID=59916 RepID=UPI001A979949|nr:uncharacterized protein LOC120780134 isoform X1 [Bactrocera tryoni]XP_039968360.1 uncharacterized protein LOC120780134 isoform X1 [Bactrocera tryoni]XP_050341257.1 uncharacterized protein LOC126767731 isoform X1 [Bactrocera neohumeralis]XP_050341258.1 uncharacterized protein LOC126767731 isoform X1 [Bactrocera neohumeralis]
MLNQRRLYSYLLLLIVSTNYLLLTYAYPQNEVYQRQLLQKMQQSPVYQSTAESTGRKYAVKPNASKKVALDDVEDDGDVVNQLSETPTGFSWSNMLSTVLTMFFNGAANAPSKSDDIDNSVGFGGSPWANVISMGLKIINTLLGGGAPSDGIDKVDNGGSPMQNILAAVLSSVLGTKDPDQVNSMAKQAGEFIQIVMNLLDALKTSFSHRSLSARSMGKRDSVSDATVAGLSLLKGYVRTYRNADDKCMQRYMCEANSECVREIGGASIFCQLGSYATSYFLDRTSDGKFEHLYDAGRRGRSGYDCHQLFLECNEV